MHYEVLSRFTKLLPASTGERNTRSAKRNRSKTYEYVINNSFSTISSLPILALAIRFAAFESAEETIQPYANCSTSPSHLTPTQHRRRHLPHPSSCQHFPSSGNDRQPCASIVIYFVSVLGGRKAHHVDPPFKATEILMFHNFWVGPCYVLSLHPSFYQLNSYWERLWFGVANQINSPLTQTMTSAGADVCTRQAACARKRRHLLTCLCELYLSKG